MLDVLRRLRRLAVDGDSGREDLSSVSQDEYVASVQKLLPWLGDYWYVFCPFSVLIDAPMPNNSDAVTDLAELLACADTGLRYFDAGNAARAQAAWQWAYFSKWRSGSVWVILYMLTATPTELSRGFPTWYSSRDRKDPTK
jgi:hypothetical protein